VKKSGYHTGNARTPDMKITSSSAQRHQWSFADMNPEHSTWRPSKAPVQPSQHTGVPASNWARGCVTKGSGVTPQQVMSTRKLQQQTPGSAATAWKPSAVFRCK
jgi:hypothetical protein